MINEKLIHDLETVGVGIDRLKATITKLERERDEARAKAGHFDTLIEAMLGAADARQKYGKPDLTVNALLDKVNEAKVLRARLAAHARVVEAARELCAIDATPLAGKVYSYGTIQEVELVDFEALRQALADLDAGKAPQEPTTSAKSPTPVIQVGQIRSDGDRVNDYDVGDCVDAIIELAARVEATKPSTVAMDELERCYRENGVVDQRLLLCVLADLFEALEGKSR